ncbi:MAG: penicillin-binding transpeptidase domain-containing protein, partial [Actinomycetota bacterium]|nr:penicillin-binding transpeptidase domain-containing protein [Actinomycetota bacterium]
ADLPKRPNPSIVLGAYEVSPLDMATAYATIANGGRRVEPTTISKVVKNQGQQGEEILYEAPAKPEGEQVIDPEIAHEATEIMIGDVTEGIADDASLGDQPVAGKTGTSENFFDAWFIGYTPHLLTGLWMGYADGGQTLEYELEYARELNGLQGGITPAMIWKTYMERVLGGETIEQFEGVDMPKEERTVSETESPNTTGPRAPEPVREGTPNPSPPIGSNVNVDPPGVRASSVSPSTAGPSTAGPSSVSPSSARPSRNGAGRVLR